MGNGSSINQQPKGSVWWIKYCREEWRSLRVKQLDELLGLQRPALRRGQSSANLEELVRKLTQDPLPLLNESEDNNDLKAAIAKLNSGSILHTEKRAIERLLAERYEDALAIATASAEQQSTPSEELGGGSEVLQKVLTVLRHNSLDTELDRSGTEEPAEWRVRTYAARRRAFLVVRSMVRLKREVKRLSAPIHDLGWLLPVAAQERWGELKGLAARYRRLEGVLHDTEVAVLQLTQLREVQAKTLGPARNSPGGRASPANRALRSGAGRVSAPGTAGRSASESGTPNSRGRTRAMLTADPPPPPVSGVRGGRRNTATPDPDAGGGGAASAPVFVGSSHPRTPMNGKQGGAGGAEVMVLNGNGGASSNGGPTTSALVPTISARRASGSGALVGATYSRRISASGNGNLGGVAPPLPGLLHNGVVTPGRAPCSVRQSYCGGSSDTSPTALPYVTRVAQAMDLTVCPPAGFTLHHNHFHAEGGHHAGALALPSTPAPDGPPSLLSPISVNSLASSANSPGGMQPRRANAHALVEALANGSMTPRGTQQSRPWGPGGLAGVPPVAPPTVEPSPPPAPPPASGARRPLGPLSHSLPSPLSAASSASGRATADGTAATAAANGSAALAGAPSQCGAPAPAQGLQVLIQDGETLDQALARFKLLADDTRCALVDTSRQFRSVLDRCNSAWPDQRWWLAAHTQEDAALDTWTNTDDYVVNRADIVRCLKAGVVAFQFMCSSDEPLVGSSGSRFDWWTSDPWEVAADLAPDKVAEVTPPGGGSGGHPPGEPSERLVGMPLGVRVLQQLANNVAEVAGPLAVEVLPVVLHVAERQLEAIAADLLQYGIYRRLRRNLFLVVQRSHPVMRYSPGEHAYAPAPDQPRYLPGTGYSMLQLLWPGHALILNEAGELERLPHSLMEELRRRNTEWLISRTCQDLSLLLEDGALDLRSLTHVLHMWNTPHLRYSVAVEAASTYVKHRDMILAHGSVLLCRKPKVSGMVLGRLDGAVRVDRYGGGAKPQLPVVELAACELNSGHMQHELAQVATARATATSVGLGRYYFRFEVLSALLTGPTVLRPKLLPAVDVRVAGMMGGPAMLRHPPSSSTTHTIATDNVINPIDGAAATTTTAPPSATPSAAPATPSAAGSGASSVPVMLPFPTTSGGFSEHQLAYAACQGLDTVLLRLHLSMSDLTVHHAAKVVALKAHRLPVLVRGPQDGPRLVELLTRSDRDLSTATQRLAAKLPSFARQQKQGQNILVFVQDNSVSLTATNVAAGLVRRERGDRIHLVTVVPTEAQRGEGAALLERLMKAFRTQADVLAHVMCQDGRGLLECVADIVSQHRCGLLVVGSTSITAVATTQPRSSPLMIPGTAAGGAKRGAAGGAAARSGTASGGGRGGAGGVGGGAGAVGSQPPVGGLLDEAASAELLLSSVALSILRTFALPLILVTVNTRNYLKRHVSDAVTHGNPRPARPAVGGVGGAASGRLSAMAVVERHSRPMMHHLARCLLEPSLRQDALTLTQVLPPGLAPGNAGYVPSSIHTVALRTLMANFESIAAANDFHTPAKVQVQGDWHNALCAAARDHAAQLLCVQLAPGTTKSLPTSLLQLVRSAPCPVLIYPERVIVPGSEALASEGED